MHVTAEQIHAALRASLPSRLRVIKADSPADRYVLGLAYPANRLDGHGEYMDARTVELMAWRFMRDGGRQVGVQHADGATGVAQVVESFVWRWDPWTTADTQGAEQTIQPGDWLVGAIFDPPTWRLIRSGKLTGWSIDGIGRRVAIPKSEAVLR